MKLPVLLLLLVLLLSAACSREKTTVVRAFYYWKSSEAQLTAEDEQQLVALRTQKLYVKFFEVAPSDIYGTTPEAKTRLQFYNYRYAEDTALRAVMTQLEVIPTVFVRNEALKGRRESELDSLADNIVFLVKKYYGERFEWQQASYKELQIDCDWTPSTKENYFRLLKTIKALSKKTISCTLRLYPYKYAGTMGVPPVDKATLMCYNLIHPLAYENRNSILENEELEDYLRGVDRYPLHLDIALPVFSWMQVYHNKEFTGLIDFTPDELKGSVTEIRPMWYEVSRDVVAGDRFLKQGDLLKFENAAPATLRETIHLLKKHIAFDKTTTVSLFHLDGARLLNINDEDLLSFYTDFSK